MSEKENRDIMLRIRITEEENKILEDLSEKFKMNKSRLVRNMIFGEIDDMQFLTKIGFLPFVQKMKAYYNNLKGVDYWDSIKYETQEDYEKAQKNN